MAGWAGNLKKIGEFYWCRFRHKGVEIHRSTGKRTLPEAQAWLVEYRRALEKLASGKGPAPSVGLLLELWMERHHAMDKEYLARVERDFRLYLLPTFREVAADKVTSADITMVLRRFMDGTNAITGKRRTKRGANSAHTSFRLVWRWGVADGLLQEMPWHVKKQQVQRRPKATLPVAKIPAFLQTVDKARNPHVGISTRAQLYMGLRESESLHLRYEWFTDDFRGYTPGKFLEGAFHSKGGEAVVVPIPPQFTRMILATLVGRTPPFVGFVIPARDGLPHRGQYTYLHVKLAGEAVGVLGLSPHRLRGTCATLLARAGVDAFVIQSLLRHKDMATSSEYVEVDFDSVREVYKDIFPSDEGGGTKSGTTALRAVLQRRVKMRLKIIA